VRPSADPEVCLSELASLWTAASADALHRVLVLHPHGRESADAFEPIALLAKHHATEPGSSAATATLLLTDRRWCAGVGRLVRAIAESGLLTAEQLDGLALAFLAADRSVYWPVPDAWFTEESVALVVSDDVGEGADDVALSEGPALAARDVAPPLRRWAAARLVAGEPAAWTRLLARAQDLDARHGAAVVAGMFDSIERLPGAAQAWLVSKGLTWPHHSVRRAALEVVAVRDGAHVALELAREDPNAKIRDWAATLGRPLLAAPELNVGGSHQEPDRSHDNGDQATLF
jgi:hypothetical protein